MDRPDEVERCVESILSGTVAPFEIVVSDDSRQPEATRALCARYPLVRYIEGPRKGQGPNRDWGAKSCQGDFVSFIDDDARMAPDFIETLLPVAESSDGKTIFTGNLWENGALLSPTNLTFWGHFGAPVVERLETVIFNTNLFPRAVFEVASFDRHLKYGYEDSDFCSQALAAGFRIVHVPQVCNTHLPSDINRAYCYQFREEARFYTSLKRYWILRRQPHVALAYCILAPAHQIAHCIRTQSWRSVPQTLRDMRNAMAYLRDEMRLRREAA